MDENEYIEKWINTDLTLSEWLQYKNIDHWETINQLDLKETQIEEIEQHQFHLFNECLRNIINNKVERLNRFEERGEKILKNTAKEHLRVIELFVSGVQINSVILELLTPIILIREADYLPVLKNYQSLISLQYNDFRTDFNVAQKGKFLDSHYLSASILFEYRKELKQIIKPPLQTKLQAPTIGLFCRTLSDGKIDLKGNQPVEKYCKMICKKYKLRYSDRVRQNFNGSDTKKNTEKIKKLILPKIDKSIREKITKYLDSKDQPEQKLYG